MRIYLDSSALVKLAQPEAETNALYAFLRRHRGDERVASALARVEVLRSAFRGGPLAVAQAREQLSTVYLMAISRRVLDRAATLAPSSPLRTLDAIHLATAQLLGGDLRSLVTYDVRMAESATALGMTVVAPN